jgi:inward rectifier potassium channel
MPNRRDTPVAIRIGETKIYKVGVRRIDLSDLYHKILTLSWPRFFVLVVAFFLLINLVFAAAYFLVEGSVMNARPGSFLDLFFFSIETLATVGYGAMSPGSLYGHIVSSIEILAGMMSLAIVTGLIFSRFAKPTARILFSDKVLIRGFEGSPVLMLRVANERHNRIVEAHATLGLTREEKTREGESYFRIYDLPLVRGHTPVFALTWTLLHRIDESSPLFGWNKERLAESRTRISVSITGYDETMVATVHSLHDYQADQIHFNARFVDVVLPGPNGERMIDLRRFHDVLPMP